MKFGIKVMPREVILDTQGRAVEDVLKQNSFSLNSCRVGKFIEVTLDESDESKAHEKIKQMVEFVLYNPLIETYEIKRMN